MKASGIAVRPPAPDLPGRTLSDPRSLKVCGARAVSILLWRHIVQCVVTHVLRDFPMLTLVLYCAQLVLDASRLYSDREIRRKEVWTNMRSLLMLQASAYAWVVPVANALSETGLSLRLGALHGEVTSVEDKLSTHIAQNVRIMEGVSKAYTAGHPQDSAARNFPTQDSYRNTCALA